MIYLMDIKILTKYVKKVGQQFKFLCKLFGHEAQEAE